MIRPLCFAALIGTLLVSGICQAADQPAAPTDFVISTRADLFSGLALLNGDGSLKGDFGGGTISRNLDADPERHVVYFLRDNGLYRKHVPEGRAEIAFTAPTEIVGMSVGDLGNIFVAECGATCSTMHITKITPGASQIGSFDIQTDPNRNFHFDVGRNECVLYAVATGRLQRYDVCTQTPLADLTLRDATDVRFLRDGRALVAQKDRVSLLGLDGAINKEYIPPFPVPMWFITIPQDGTIWAGERQLVHFDLSGDVIGTVTLSTGGAYLLDVLSVGEALAASPQPATIPAVGHTALAILAITLCVIGIRFCN